MSLGWNITSDLADYRQSFNEGMQRLKDERIIERLWKQDHTIWKPDPDEISNRLGWLFSAEEMENHLGQLEALAFAARGAGLRRAVLLGMGGSSLAPELFARSFPSGEGGLQLTVLDSTDPSAVNALHSSLDYGQTLFFVSTKSGGTVETFSFLKYFYRQAVAALGASKAGNHFIAITDPGSGLADVAKVYHFQATLLNDPNIGGRYSALSYFGLAPASFSGVDLPRLLRSARVMASACRNSSMPEGNPAAVLGTILGCLGKEGRDKVTFVLSPQLGSFGDWVEQLIAESTGKQGRGLLPVVGEGLLTPETYGSDRTFVYLTLASERNYDPALFALEDAGHPLVRVEIEDLYDLGGQFMLWELATAIAGYFLEINPFDQPNVESAKVRARQMVAAYQQSGSLPEDQPDIQEDGISVYGSKAKTVEAALKEFAAQAQRGDYIALQAFVQPQEATTTALQSLRRKLLETTRVATTSGYGPRFLHSTGQLHKGDAGNGLFIQFTSANPVDVPIPNEMNTDESSLSFGVLKLAQAMGDLQALRDAGRRAVRFHFETGVEEGIRRLTAALE